MLKNIRWSPLNTEMAKAATLGAAKPLTVTNLGRKAQKMTFIYLKDGEGKNCLKRFLVSTEHING